MHMASLLVHMTSTKRRYGLLNGRDRILPRDIASLRVRPFHQSGHLRRHSTSHYTFVCITYSTSRRGSRLSNPEPAIRKYSINSDTRGASSHNGQHQQRRYYGVEEWRSQPRCKFSPCLTGHTAARRLAMAVNTGCALFAVPVLRTGIAWRQRIHALRFHCLDLC